MPRQTNKKETSNEPTPTPATTNPPAAEAPGNRTLMLVGAIVVVLLIGVSLWQLGFFGGTPIQPIPNTNNTTNTTSTNLLDQPQAKLLAGLINKTRQIPATYQAIYKESAGGASREVAIRADGQWTEARTQTLYYTRTYLWKGNQTILCENNNETNACQALNETDEKWAEAQQMEGMTFPTQNQSARIWENYKKLINNSQFKFDGNATTKNVAGRTCQAIAYRLGENNLTICLDQQYGVVLGQEMTYDQPYQTLGSTQTYYRKAAYKLEAQEISFETQVIVAPEVENNTKALDMAKTDDAEWAALLDCQAINDTMEQRRCFKDNAISFNDVRFCEQNLNDSARGDCVIKVATQSGQLKPELCGKAGAMKSECYANIAYLKKDSSYCLLVMDTELRKTCDDAMKSLGNQTKSG